MRPKGIARLYNRGRLLWEAENLFVNAGLPLLANLIAGVMAGQSITAIGFGSGALAPRWRYEPGSNAGLLQRNWCGQFPLAGKRAIQLRARDHRLWRDRAYDSGAGHVR